jgi:GTP pyrophosphokinase
VEIITSAKQKPHEDWLGLVTTARAKSRIKDALREEKRKVADDGRQLLERKLAGMGATASTANLEALVEHYRLPSALELCYRIAVKSLDLRDLKTFQVVGDRLEPPRPARPEAPEARPEAEAPRAAGLRKDTELVIFGESADRILYQLANCCKPIPGDDVFGFVSTGKGLIIHRTNCPNAARLMANYAHRVVKTKWAKNKEISFLTGLRITGIDDVGVIHKITNLISGELRININAITVEAREGVFEGNIRLYVHDRDELDRLVERLKQLPGIHQVVRYDAEAPPAAQDNA